MQVESLPAELLQKALLDAGRPSSSAASTPNNVLHVGQAQFTVLDTSAPREVSLSAAGGSDSRRAIGNAFLLTVFTAKSSESRKSKCVHSTFVKAVYQLCLHSISEET